MNNFSFYHNVFNSCLLHHNASVSGKGLTYNDEQMMKCQPSSPQLCSGRVSASCVGGCGLNPPQGLTKDIKK